MKQSIVKLRHMIVQQAAKIAADYLQGLVPKATNIQLEEVERTGTSAIWNITLSYDSNDTTGFIATSTRKLKYFKIADSNGKVISMKMNH